MRKLFLISTLILISACSLISGKSDKIMTTDILAGKWISFQGKGDSREEEKHIFPKNMEVKKYYPEYAVENRYRKETVFVVDNKYKKYFTIWTDEENLSDEDIVIIYLSIKGSNRIFIKTCLLKENIKINKEVIFDIKDEPYFSQSTYEDTKSCVEWNLFQD